MRPCQSATVNRCPSVQGTLDNEQRKKETENGDKNPIFPVVTKREEISECEQGEVDWTLGGQNTGHPYKTDETRPWCVVTAPGGEPGQDKDLFSQPFIYKQTLFEVL